MANTKRILRIAVPLIIILLPVAFFLIMRQGENVYRELPHLGTPQGISPNGDTIWHQVPPFSFTDQHGNAYGSEDLKDKIYVADFIFTRCPNICPVMTKNLKAVQDKMKKIEEFRIVSFSLDPKYDTVEALAAFAEKHGADPEKWHFLTGPKEEIYPLMNQQGFLIVQPLPHEDPAQFQHSEIVVLVDKEGHIRGSYDGTDEKEMDRLVDEMRVLLLSYKDDESN